MFWEGVNMALKNLFDNYMEFEEIINRKNDGNVDLGDVELNPTSMFPLLCICMNQNLKLLNGEDAFEYFEKKLNGNQLFSKLPKFRTESDESDFLTN